MDTRTLQALGVLLDHETTDELKRLREENKKLREFKNNVLRNNNKFMNELYILIGMIEITEGNEPEDIDDFMETIHSTHDGTPSIGYNYLMEDYDQNQLPDVVKNYCLKYPEIFYGGNTQRYFIFFSQLETIFKNHFNNQDSDKKHYDYINKKINPLKVFENDDIEDIDHNEALKPNNIFYVKTIEELNKQYLKGMLNNHLIDIYNKRNSEHDFKTIPFNNTYSDTIHDLIYYDTALIQYIEEEDIIPDINYKPRIFYKTTNKELTDDERHEYKHTIFLKNQELNRPRPRPSIRQSIIIDGQQTILT